MVKNEVINFKLPTEEKAKIKKLSEEIGEDMTKFISASIKIRTNLILKKKFYNFEEDVLTAINELSSDIKEIKSHLIA